MDPTTTAAPILQLRFMAEVLTVRGDYAVVLTDVESGGEPYRFVGDRVVVSRSALRSVRVLTESDLNDQDPPSDIQLSRRTIARPG